MKIKETIENQERIERYTNIAFCQRCFYVPAAWRRAMKCMDILVSEGYAEPFDFGYGKGKFTTTPKGDNYGFNKLYEIVVKSGLKIKPMKG